MATETTKTSTTAAPPPPPNGADKGALQTEAGKPDAKVDAKVEAKPTQEELALAGGEKKPDAKPDEKKPDAKVEGGDKPAPIELKLPEGFKADEPAIKAFTEKAAKLGLSKEQAQGAFDTYVEFTKTRDEALAAEFRKERADWLAEAKADKEIGGANWDKSLADARKGISKFGSPELEKHLLSTNGINHPAQIRAWAKVGASLREDNATGDKPAPRDAAKDPQAALQRTYPSMFNADGTPKA